MFLIQGLLLGLSAVFFFFFCSIPSTLGLMEAWNTSTEVFWDLLEAERLYILIT